LHGKIDDIICGLFDKEKSKGFNYST
jgi:hypothetical protein